jgi:rod shape-determining protein MreD
MRGLRTLVLGLAMLLGQMLVVNVLPPPARPDLVLIFSMAMGLARGYEARALLLAFGLGFTLDVLSGNPPGLWALLRGTACVATRLFDRALYLRAPVPWAVYATGWAFADWTLQAVVVHNLVPDVSLPWNEVLRLAPVCSVVTGVCAGLLMGAFRRIDAEADRDGDWSLLASSPTRR